jgi:WD40 repeat protein
VLEGHTSSVFSVAFSPDGQFLVSGSRDQSVRLWNIDSGEQVRVLKGHTDRVSSVAFSPDGQFLVSGSRDKSVRLWNIDSGEQVQVFNGHTDKVTSVAFSPNGQFLVSGSGDKSVRLWNIDSGEQVQVFEGHTGWVNSVAFSPNGQFLVSESYHDNTKCVWNASTGASLYTGPDDQPLPQEYQFQTTKCSTKMNLSSVSPTDLAVGIDAAGSKAHVYQSGTTAAATDSNIVHLFHLRQQKK